MGNLERPGSSSPSFGVVFNRIVFQIRLLIWKRWKESTKSKFEIFKVLFPAMLFFSLLLLIYKVFNGLFFPDGAEAFIVPLAFWIYMQRIVVQIMHEKATRLHESMRMMGMSDVAYWASYFLFDGLFVGFIISFICCLFSTGGLFNDANFGTLLGLFLSFCLSSVTFCFFITAFFDTPQTAGQALLAILLGMYVMYVVVFIAGTHTISYNAAEIVCCLFPPFALQIGSGAFLNSYDGIGIQRICNIMVADIFIYAVLAWYAAQVWPSKLGVAKPFYFFLLPSYWLTPAQLAVYFPNKRDHSMRQSLSRQSHTQDGANKFPEEAVDEGIVGEATVTVNRLRKSYASAGGRVVNNLSLKMYANQIFALLGHNGAGKTTTISMLTGLIAPDFDLFGEHRAATEDNIEDNDAKIYGHSIKHDMDAIRSSLGVCPQHDVLFDRLTVGEHIVFFSLLKSSTISTAMPSMDAASAVPSHDPFSSATAYTSTPTFTFADAEAEATALSSIFHLQHRRNHTGSELSGGQKRKLSVAIAICGGSKFIVLDEPTAGMDPLARRELWDLLSNLRHGRTMLLTTHYMDEADVLGDRVGIMSHGQMLCCGSTPFLKRTFGAGYQLIFDRDRSISLRDEVTVKQLVSFLQEQFNDSKSHEDAVEVKRVIAEEEETFFRNLKSLPASTVSKSDIAYPPLVISLPFHASRRFGKMFTALENSLERFRIAPGSFGVTITSLEDVFLRVGAAHDNNIAALDGKERLSVAEILDTASNTNGPNQDIGKLNENTTALMKSTQALGLSPHLVSQILGIMWRRLRYAMHDFVTIPLVALPIIVAIAAAILYNLQVISNNKLINDLVVSGMYIGAYLGAPGLIAEFLVRERSDKLRTVLTVMGCKFSAYWIGTFFADFLIMCIPTVVIYITWFSAGMSDFIHGEKSPGLCFFLMLLFNIQMIAFSYFFSGVFSVPKSCISLMPIIVLLLIISPMVVLLIIIQIAITSGTSIGWDVVAGVQLWGIMLTTPHGALFCALLDSTQDYSSFIKQFPVVGATIFFMIFESVLYLSYAFYADSMTVANVSRFPPDPSQDMAALEALDEDVIAERKRTEKVLEERFVPNAMSAVLPIDQSSAAVDPESGLQLRSSSAVGSSSSVSSAHKDDIVAANNSNNNNESAPPLVIDRLRKVFPPKGQSAPNTPGVIAVEDVMFSVQKGEIFGLLGANGAGKTTTLSMLTRHLLPTSGDATIAGHSILTDFTRGAGHMGVVTQSNSLWDRLSVRDHLYLFARLRGVPPQILDETVTSTLQNLELWSHRDKLAMSLSGGMKRKLCVAIALIGDPEVVLLDEPSAGLDPVSRRNLWRVILTTMSNRAVILTTHSMEEAEALCRRIGIMVLGQLRCLGSKQHLKNKFGSGFELSVKLLAPGPSAPPADQMSNKGQSPFHEKEAAVMGESKSTEVAAATAVASTSHSETAASNSPLAEKVEQLHVFLASHFPSVAQIAQNGSLLTFQIPKDEMRLGVAFTAIEAEKERLGIEDYVIAQPTLEQVFIRTVRRHTPDENDAKKKGKGGKRRRKKKKATNELSDVPITLGGTVRMSMEGTRTLGDLEYGADRAAEASKDLGNVLRESIMSLTGVPVNNNPEDDDDEYEDDDEDDLQNEKAHSTSMGARLKYLCCDSDDRNKCGCTNFCVKMMAVIAGVIALVFLAVAFAEGASGDYQLAGFMWTLTIIAIIVSCCGCNILCCACCQYPKDIE